MPDRQQSLASPAILIPFLAITLIWSSTWIVIKDQLGSGAEAVPAAWSVAYRFASAGAAMFAMARLSGASLRLGRAGHGFAVAIGIPQFVLNFQLVYAAEHHVTSGIVALVFALPVAEGRAGYWLGLAYLGLLASALAFFYCYRIIRAIGPAKAAYSSVLVPIVAMGLSTLFEDYRWTALAAAGGALALIGLVVALSGRRPAEPAPIPD